MSTLPLFPVPALSHVAGPDNALLPVLQHPQASQIERFGPARISAGPGGRTPVSWPPFHRCCFSTSRRQRDLDFNAVPGLFLSRINHDAIIDETSQQRRRRRPPPPPPPHFLHNKTVGEGTSRSVVHRDHRRRCKQCAPPSTSHSGRAQTRDRPTRVACACPSLLSRRADSVALACRRSAHRPNFLP